ncbi:phosphohydrolase [Burkholderia stagnalis]
MTRIMTYTGRELDLLDPRPEAIDIRDIAHALAWQCRFNGHTRTFYSVADHSIRVATQLPAPLRLAGLLHDAAEAYLGDLIQPVKALVPGFAVLEQSVWEAIASRFGLPLVLPPVVKFVDEVLFATECRDLVVRGESAWRPDRPMLDEPIHPLSRRDAEAVFLHLFDRYYGAGASDEAPRVDAAQSPVVEYRH